MSISLRNDALAVTIRSERGGRIDQISDLACGKDWLWHPEGYQPELDVLAPASGKSLSFDACWSGGFEEMFPNDAAGELAGRALRDHGELWSSTWTVLEQWISVSRSTRCARYFPSATVCTIAPARRSHACSSCVRRW